MSHLNGLAGTNQGARAQTSSIISAITDIPEVGQLGWECSLQEVRLEKDIVSYFLPRMP